MPTGGSDYHGDTGPYAEAHAQLWVPPEVGERLFAALGSEPAAASMPHAADRPHDPPACRSSSSIPVEPAGDAARRPPSPPTSGSPSTGRRRPPLPSFHVWTLGCQMNRSDSEEMAGRLLAAGCAEAPASRRPTSS